MTDTPESLRLEGAGIELQAYDYGNKDAQGMILVHGIQDQALGLAPLAEAFRERYHVVSFDLRGHGDSDKPGIYALPHFVADLHAVLAQVQLRDPVLVGHSLGGHIVSWYGGIFAEVPNVIVNIEGIGAPFREDAVPEENRQWRLRNGIASLLRPGGHKRPMGDLEDAWHLFCRFHPRMDPEHARYLAEVGTCPHPHGGLQWKWDPHVETVGLTMSPEASRARWAAIECPTLVVTAADSADFYRGRGGIDPEAQPDPDEITRRVSHFKNATHIEIANAGHMVHFDNPSDLIQAITTYLG